MGLPLSDNLPLGALPPADRARLLTHAAEATFGLTDDLYRAGGPIDHVYFPQSGLLSAVVIMADGATAEVAGVGREGMLGAAVSLGGTRSAEEVFCQIAPATCLKLPAADFAREVARFGAVRDVVHG